MHKSRVHALALALTSAFVATCGGGSGSPSASTPATPGSSTGSTPAPSTPVTQPPVAATLCDRLGYANPNKAMGDHCRGVPIRYPIPDALGRMQQTRVLTEADVMIQEIKSA